MITSEKVLRKMNEIQHHGGVSIGHWHQLRKWLLEDEQIKEDFLDAVKNDSDMTAQQKDFWFSQALIDAINRYRDAHSACEASGEKTAELNDAYANLLVVCDNVKRAGASSI